MALTKGAKKFGGLVLAIAIVGGGIYTFKSGLIKLPASTPSVQAEAPAQEIPQPVSSPIFQAEQVNKLVEQPAPAPQAAPVAPIQAADPTANRGMAALLKAGQK